MNNEEKAARNIRNPTFQALQKWFSKAYDLGTGIFDRRVRLLTYEVNHKDYCSSIRKNTAGIRRCRLSDANLIHECETKKHVCWHVCGNGLLDFGIPIKMRGKPVAFLLAGQLRGEFRGLSTEKNSKICMKGTLNREFKDIPVFTAERLEQIDEAARRFGEMLSSLLTKLDEWEPPERTLKEYIEKARSANTVDELLEISVEQFPKIIGSKQCSIFCVGEVVDKGERLILRKTSYKPLEKELEKGEVTAFYDYGKGFTGWVWKHGRSLRVSDIGNKAELMSIYPEDPPRWSGKLKDSPRRREFLCVPIFGRSPPSEVIGVIRTPMKADGFTVDDEITLSALGDYLYSLIELCERRERAMKVQKAFEVALGLQQCTSQTDVWKMLRSAAMSFFGCNGKAYLINILEHEGDSFTISHVGGDLSVKNLIGRKIRLHGTATGYVLSQQAPIPLLIHDIKKAKNEKRYFPVVKGGRSGMLAPIRSNEGHCLGIIAVIADKQYAFNQEDLALLSNLAECASKACEYLKISTAAAEAERLHLLSNILNGLMHDLGDPVARVNQDLREVVFKTPQDELAILTDFTLNGLHAYQFAPVKSPSGELMGLDKSLIQRVRSRTSTFELEILLHQCVKVLDLCGFNLPAVVIRCPNGYKVNADYEILMLIMYNLLKNSKKYADEHKLNELRINLSVKRDGKYTIITVMDCNKPLTEEAVKSLSEFKPNALGLAISSVFAHAHPGRPPSERGTLIYKRVQRKNVFTVEICG